MVEQGRKLGTDLQPNQDIQQWQGAGGEQLPQAAPGQQRLQEMPLLTQQGDQTDNDEGRPGKALDIAEQTIG